MNDEEIKPEEATTMAIAGYLLLLGEIYADSGSILRAEILDEAACRLMAAEQHIGDLRMLLKEHGEN